MTSSVIRALIKIADVRLKNSEFSEEEKIKLVIKISLYDISAFPSQVINHNLGNKHNLGNRI